MPEVIRVHQPDRNGELDVDQLADQIAQQVAERLARLFPDDATEFWGALAAQADQSRRQAAAIVETVRPYTSKDALDVILAATGVESDAAP